METLRPLLALVLVGYTIYSLIAYAVRRAGTRGAFLALLRSAPVRRLTPEERAAVAPFLVDPLRPGRPLELLDEQVRALRGPFVRHGIQGRGAETLHDTIGEVDVVLPYDARDHLELENRAEVVVAGRSAIVLALNGTFDLAGGRARTLQEQAAEQPRAAGEPGASPAALPPALDAPPRAQVLGQRQETEAEAAARAGFGWGGLAAACFAACAALLAAASGRAAPLPWLAPAAALGLAGLWLAWRPRSAPAARPVDRLRGPLVELTLQSPGNAAVERRCHFVGEIPVVLPRGWARRLEGIAPGAVLEVDVRAGDHHVVRVGDLLSIDAEVRHAVPVRWVPHLTLALAGAAIALASWLVFRPLDADVAHARARLRPAPAAALDDPAAVQARPPAPGELVHVRAQVRCQLVSAQQGLAPVSCDVVRWGAEPPVVPAVELPPELVRLRRPDLIEARPEPWLTLRLKRQLEQAGELPFGGPPLVYRVMHLSALVREVDAVCGSDTAGLPDAATRWTWTSCEDLRTAVGALRLDGEEDPVGWTRLRRKVQAGLRGSGDTAIALDDALRRLRSALRDLAEPHVRARYAAALAVALESQRGGVLLPLSPELVQALRSPEEEPGARSDWPERWAEYEALAAPAALRPLAFEGLVTSVSSDDRGDLVLAVDPSRTRENAVGALLRLAAVLLGAALVTIHGPLLALTGRRALARARQVDELRDRRAGRPRRAEAA